MVTIRRFLEKEMGYRGSKSDSKLKSVKEQRVDGSWHNFILLVFKVYSNGFSKETIKSESLLSK
jgi:hypothetical protein